MVITLVVTLSHMSSHTSFRGFGTVDIAWDTEDQEMAGSDTVPEEEGQPPGRWGRK